MIDIVTGCGYPGDKLSNFEAYEFEIDEITCYSMEGFLQSLKFNDPEKQKEICLLIGKKAKFKGKKKKWWINQTLFWKGKEINRHGEEYQALVAKAFSQLAKNERFKRVLLDTKNEEIKHSEGKKDPTKTILTEDEFCFHLMNVRNNIQKEQS
jgi:predicted NAD-dependent protein-ADP-ribosyltransferase YbiA (DUF1768 family)